MLVVRAEIWPGGDEDRAVLVGEIRAANISNLAEISSYSVEISQAADSSTDAEPWTRTFVLRVSRGVSAHGVW